MFYASSKRNQTLCRNFISMIVIPVTVSIMSTFLIPVHIPYHADIRRRAQIYACTLSKFSETMELKIRRIWIAELFKTMISFMLESSNVHVHNRKADLLQYSNITIKSEGKEIIFFLVIRMSDRITERAKHGGSERLVQESITCTQYSSCRNIPKWNCNYVQKGENFCTDYSIGRYRPLICKRHKHIMNGIDYLSKNCIVNIYINSLWSKNGANTLDFAKHASTDLSNAYHKTWNENLYHRIGRNDTLLLLNMFITTQPKTVMCICTTEAVERENIHKKMGTIYHKYARFIKLVTMLTAIWMLLMKKKHTKLNLHIFLLLLLCTPTISTSKRSTRYSTNIIMTKYGPLRGILMPRTPTVEAFLGVPYASPPVGSLRYMPPVTPSTWKRTRLADNFSPVCPQTLPKLQYEFKSLVDQTRGRSAQIRRLLPLLSNQSEDCLYLNLYVPRSDDSMQPSGSPKATIMYIHGESYEWNSGNPYDGSVLALQGNVIVVTINFRLGILGFLKTGAKGSNQGNFGLMDLVAALHWLKENLSAFHGDPLRITLMGHGTGAALANMLVVSPVASDLINRAILLSGSALSPWAIQREPLSLKKLVAEQTACHIDVIADDLAPCLRTKSITELLRITPESPRFLPGYAPFVDGTVIMSPTSSNVRLILLPSGSAITSTTGIEFANFASRELLFGLTSYESYNDLSAQDLENGFNETRRDRILRTYVRNVFHFHLKEIYSTLRNEYTEWEHPPRNLLGHRDTILELLSDGHTAAPLIRLGYLHSLQNGKSFFLHFRHQTGDCDFPQRSGSVRGEDIPFIFGLPLSPLFPSNFTEEDVQISRFLIQYLTNFVKTGNPNGIITSDILNTPSPQYKTRSVRYSDDNKINIVFNNTPQSENVPSMAQKNHFFKRFVRGIVNATIIDNKYKHSMNKRSLELYRNREQEEYAPISERESIGNNYDDDNDDADDDEKKDGVELIKWKMYDPINQNYMELGCNIVSKNHYRGHKLSLWLSLIPQLHSPVDSAHLPMRHHHFTEIKPEYYEGRVKDIQISKLPKLIAIAKSTSKPHKTETIVVPFAHTVSTECPPNTTVMSPVAATHPQRIAMNSLEKNGKTVNQLTNPQYHQYSAAFNITIGVGSFLLLLNVLIFVAIYFKKEKRASMKKPRENITGDEILHSTSLLLDDRLKHQKTDRDIEYDNDTLDSAMQDVSSVTTHEQYSCNKRNSNNNEKYIPSDICNQKFPVNEHSCSSPTTSIVGSIQNSTAQEMCKHTSEENLVTVYPRFPSQSTSTSESSSNTTGFQLRRNSSTNDEMFHNSSEQTNLPEMHEIGTIVDEIELEFSSMMMDSLRSARSVGIHGGILRQQTGSVIHGTTKKRVQIQEISV
ncbi:neuroligin-4, X-linked isoform X2 [Toxorhynchites rutilus septentrionalis]|uniref:neuroligin-4, X-linked isoform X2 n=1 Tax=Toxorhynchites rutilus septentrionalis TaxID=329112 RepID=UPI00247A51E9|nr:neuroligin-4, X-linked isoform X2 [Toxorhynchites rutilus septentrionalis]